MAGDPYRHTWTVIEQCIAHGTPTYLLRQAIERGHAQGHLKTTEHDALTSLLEARQDRPGKP